VPIAPTLSPNATVPTAPTVNVGNECLQDLFIALGTIYATRIFLNLGLGLLLPWILRKVMQKLTKKSLAVKHLTYIKRQANLSPYSGVLDKYNEMVIQFGYVTLFAAAFPLGPLLALINNFIELRTDGYAFLITSQRPHFQGAKDIGTWFSILELMGYLAVVSNMCIIAFTDRTEGMWATEDGSFSKYAVVAALLIENFILFLKWIAATIIPDVPASVRQAMASQEYHRELAFREVEMARREREEKHKRKKRDAGTPIVGPSAVTASLKLLEGDDAIDSD